MPSQAAKNVIGVLVVTCIICGVFIAYSPHTTPQITTETVLITEHYDGVSETISQPFLKQTWRPAIKKNNKADNQKSAKKSDVLVKEAHTTDPQVSHVVTDTLGDTSSTSSTSTTPLANRPTDIFTEDDLEQASTSGSLPDTIVYEESVTEQPPQNLTDFKMDFETSSDIGYVLESRRSHIYSMCRQHSAEIFDSTVISPLRYAKLMNKNKNIMTNHQEGISFCTVAKSGSTFWKSVFIYLGTGQIMNGLAAPRQLKKRALRSLSFWNKAKSRGETYTSFVAVRNPWKRLVSLYQQKIENFLPRLKANGFRSVKRMPQYSYMLRVCHLKPTELTTFDDMLNCVLTKNNEENPNRHWQTAYEYCDICNEDFSYIIRTENMMEEGAYVMRQAGLDTAAEILHTVRDGTIRDVEKHKSRPYSEYYRDIDPEVINKLKELYKWEIKLFNYPDTPFTT